MIQFDLRLRVFRNPFFVQGVFLRLLRKINVVLQSGYFLTGNSTARVYPGGIFTAIKTDLIWLTPMNGNPPFGSPTAVDNIRLSRHVSTPSMELVGRAGGDKCRNRPQPVQHNRQIFFPFTRSLASLSLLRQWAGQCQRSPSTRPASSPTRLTQPPLWWTTTPTRPKTTQSSQLKRDTIRFLIQTNPLR